MHISLDSALGRQRRLNSVGESVFQIAPDAAAGYSLRSLTGGDPSVVRVRRESDNGERDFRSSEINSGSMVRWVNEQITPPLDLRELTATGRDGPIIEAAAAYSLRNLSDSYTGSVVDVRRSSDGNTAPFTATEVTDGTLVAWVSEAPIAQNSTSNPYTTFTNASNTGFTATLSSATAYAGFGGVIGSSGDSVTVSFDLDVVSGSPSVALRGGLGAIASKSNLEANLGSGSYSLTFNATATFGFIGFSEGDIPSEFTVSNFEITSVSGATYVRDGTVSKWYDQSTTSGVPNAKHAVQTDAASQPKIVSGGTLVTGGLDFDGTSDFLQASIGTLTQPISGFSVFKNNSLLNSPEIWDSISPTNRVVSFAVASDDTFRISAGVAIPSASSFQVDGTTYLRSDLINTTASEGYVNGTLKMSGNAGTNSMEGLTIGARYDGSVNFTNGSIAEVIIYNSDQTDNRTALEANIGEVYGIAGIPAYDNTVNGFVETWYDQSGNGNNATQLTAGSQPKIVSAGSLVTGGLDFDGVDDTLDLSGTGLDIFKNVGYGQVFSVATSNEIGLSTARIFDDSTTATRFLLGESNATAGSFRVGGRRVNGDAFDSTTASTPHGSTENLVTGFANWSDAEAYIYQNGANVGTDLSFQTAGNTQNTASGATSIGKGAFDGKIREVIVYNTDQTANRVGIETNINNQYDIY